jgi:hypothetical protein
VILKGEVVSRTRRTATDCSATPAASATALVSAASDAAVACALPKSAATSTPSSASAKFTIGRGVGVGEFGSGAR